MLSKIEHLMKYLPFLRRYYLRHYADIRFNLFRASKLFPLMKFPRYVHLLVTYECNLNCRQCQVDASTRRVNQLTGEEIVRVIREIREAGVRHLIITGGEPLVRADIFEILRFAGESGIPRITLATNGYLVGKYRKELSEIRIDRVVTSIDDVEERNDSLRGKRGAFEKAIGALEIFKELGVREREVNTTVLPDNISRMPDLAEAISASSATRWILSPLIPLGRANAMDNRFFEDKEYLELFELIKKLRPAVPVELCSHTGYLKNYHEDVTSEPFFCRAGIETCSINPDGEVVPCNIVSDNRFSQGNVREKKFKTIWKEGFKEIRDTELPDDCNRCEFFLACRGGCWGNRVLDNKYCYKNFCE